MSLEDFFDLSKPIKRKTISAGTCAGRMLPQPREKKDDVFRDIPDNVEYAREHKDDLKRRLREAFGNKRRDVEETEMDPDSVYHRYSFKNLGNVDPLPIASSKRRIMEAIKDNTVVVIQGSTGCGKTTQVPQYILDDARARNKKCNIVVAQPRRIAAQTNAQRVCAERGWEMGTVVGYQVGSDQQANCSPDTRILFCTTGVLLEKLIHSKTLYHYTHIILDEVHERTKEMDFLMIIVYKFLVPSKKVILMSATIDSEKFAKYFELPAPNNSGAFIPAPIVNIDVARRFNVKKFFLDDIEGPMRECNSNWTNNLSAQLKIESPKVHEDQYAWALRLIFLIERADKMDAMKSGLSQDDYDSMPKNTILIFLPGIHEIRTMFNMLKEWVPLNAETKIMRIILHSTSDPSHAKLAMRPLKMNVRKVILATNIAESSITVPDVKYVIDFCLTRVLETNKKTNFSSLRLAWASHNNCEQRAGRTGRTMTGMCFRLVTKQFYNREMQSTSRPEMLHCPLEDIILKIKVLDMGTPQSVLALAMDQPYLSEINDTVLQLKEMGALLPTVGGQYEDMDGEITFVGRVMAALPIDAKLTKMIVFGYAFSILNECVVIAAALNCTKSILKVDSPKAIASYTSRLEWANGSGSDLIAMLSAYNRWVRMQKQGKFGSASDTRAGREEIDQREKQWADENHLNLVALRECQVYVTDLHTRLRRLDLKALSPEKFRWSETEKNIVLKVVISGAFYPNYFLRSSPNRTQNEREMYTHLDGRDPGTTVFLKGFETKHIRNIYTEAIKQEIFNSGIVDNPNKLKVTFDSGAQKVYITFKTDGKKDDVRPYGIACQPGFVLTEVYKAIHMRQTRDRLKIAVFADLEQEKRYATRQTLAVDTTTNLLRFEDASEYREVCFPRVFDKIIKGSITHIENCDEFYLQPQIEFEKIKQFSTEMNGSCNDLEPFEFSREVSNGTILAAPYHDPFDQEVEYHRAKILYMIKENGGDTEFMIQFIDFGNTATCKLKDLRKMSGVSAQYARIPPRCFRCALVGIQPSILTAPKGIWDRDAINVFREMTASTVIATVFSTVDCVARVTVRTEAGLNINDIMLARRFAERCEENYMSKQNHLIRDKTQRESLHNRTNYLDDGTLRYLREEDIPKIKPPGPSGMKSLVLHGPISPLETRIYSLTKEGKDKSVEIDKQSVNVVMLENEPNDISYKYLVAVSACQKQEKEGGIKVNMLNVRHTTMMPHIRAFAPLMAAIFAPAMELQCDKSKSHYVAMITGLGYDRQNNRPRFAENDITFDLDTEISIEDLENINEIRHNMNSLFYTKAEQMCAINFGDEEKMLFMENIRQKIMELLEKPRRRIAYEAGNIKWNAYAPSECMVPNTTSEYGERAIYPLHKLLKLHMEDVMKLTELKLHKKELEDLAKSECAITQNITCKLCNDSSIETTIELQHHIMARTHLDRVEAIEAALSDQLNA